MRCDGRWLGLISAVALAGLLALTAPALAGTAGSVYVANSGFVVPGVPGGTISQYDVDPSTGALTPKAEPPIAQPDPKFIALTPDGSSAYVTNQVPGDDTIAQFTVDPSTGALLAKQPATVAAGPNPFGIAVAPGGRSAYAANITSGPEPGTVSQYAIAQAGGGLSPLVPPSLTTAGASPAHVAVAPDGRSAYVTNVNSNTVAQYDVEPLSGALSPKTPATVAAGQGPTDIAISPDGRSAYVADATTDGTVSEFDIDASSGALTAKTPATVPAGLDPDGIAVTPDGRSVYAANGNDGDVSQYDVDPTTGVLLPKTPAAVASGDGPLGIAVSADGRSAYVANLRAGTISQYDIGAVSGALTPKTPATVATNPFPIGVAVGPPPAAGGVSYDELCTLTREAWNPRTRAHVLLLCALLRGARIAAAHHNASLQRLFLDRYIAIVRAASGTDLTARAAATLIADARALLPPPAG
jgi:6-phosphogluconolactonase